MGLDLGFEQAGFISTVSVENDRWAAATIGANRPDLAVIQRRIQDVSTEEILEAAQLKRGEADVLIGAPPCEPFSFAGRRNGFKDERAECVDEFIRVVCEAKPRFFVMEQVPGFVRAAKRHISYYARARMPSSELLPEERLGSAFDEIMAAFVGTGYSLSFQPGDSSAPLLNAADFGTPQKRRRFVLIGSRDGARVSLPKPTHVDPHRRAAGETDLASWVTLRVGLARLHDPKPEHTDFPSSWMHFLELVPEGGHWKHLPEELHKAALGGAYDDHSDPLTSGLKGGRTGFMRRLSWDAPSPTLVDRPTTKAGCLCHPQETRPLSVREYARIQGFPDSWKICGPTSAKYRLIGQATPVPLARAVAAALINHLSAK